jgi:hypothetical protein
MNTLHDIEFSRPKLQLSKEEFKDVADKISSAID